ncbi:MAG: hypothetical protein HOQ05_07530 [Corynebacteriales bacterium]|nr:hypothetical protein [Mycobacteriales bacterium]
MSSEGKPKKKWPLLVGPAAAFGAALAIFQGAPTSTEININNGSLFTSVAREQSPSLKDPGYTYFCIGSTAIEAVKLEVQGAGYWEGTDHRTRSYDLESQGTMKCDRVKAREINVIVDGKTTNLRAVSGEDAPKEFVKEVVTSELKKWRHSFSRGPSSPSPVVSR